jgi:phosphoribosylanthranilate isomerase
MPSGDRWIPDDTIREIAAANPNVKRFLLTCQTDPLSIQQQVLEAGTDTVQLVNKLELSALAILRNKLHNKSIVQAVHVTGPESVTDAKAIEPYVDAIILDSGKLDTPTPTFGGTGSTHDWHVSARIVNEVKCPVYLAGGLGPDNVADAIHQVKPYGVDVCSRIRKNGQLDEPLLCDFFRAIRTATPNCA